MAETATAAPPPAKPASSPSPAASPAATPPPSKSFNHVDAFAELDKLANEPDDAPAKPEEQPEKPAAKPAPKPPTKPDKPAEKPVEKPAPAEPAKEEPPTKAKELREAYEATRKERDTLRSELETLKKAGAGKDDPERVALTEKLTKEETRRQQLEEQLKYLDYQRSDEYKTKYEEPINKAFKAAYADMNELLVEDGTGTSRRATADDFNALMRMPLAEAITKAKEMFGDSAPEVLAHRRRIIQLDKDRSEAVEEYRTKGAEREKESTAKRAQQSEALKKLWDEKNKELAEKYPKFFSPEDGDEEGNALLVSGYQLADLAFDSNAKLSPEQRVQVHSELRNRAAGFARLAHRNKQLQARVEALESELDGFKESEPGKSDGERTPGKKERSWEQELDELAS